MRRSAPRTPLLMPESFNGRKEAQKVQSFAPSVPLCGRMLADLSIQTITRIDDLQGTRGRGQEACVRF